MLKVSNLYNQDCLAYFMELRIVVRINIADGTIRLDPNLLL